ncbi:MAG: aspartate--tRNA ligase [Candidatus Altiarchaeota archaeon]|nr:aspartate--tRNA ligase [Candidatus Altiarchaeota archaeon]
MLRSHNCGELRKTDIKKRVKLAGWVHSLRSFGKKAFIDLRDRHGITQAVLGEEFKAVYSELPRESVVLVEGAVVKRKQPNSAINTGEIEVIADKFIVLSKSKPLPLEIFNPDIKTTEEKRLEYRFLDLRRPEMQRAMEFRFGAETLIRQYMLLKDFVEIETPFMSRPTPEGARDFLVPSRSFKGKFWALPQSPQIYKQLLMVAGFDKYFQIVRCFRDEDLRADRQYEFTQIDIETSFSEESDIQELSEGLISLLYAQLLGIKLKRPFKQMSWEHAIDLYGSDKPDTRFGIELIELTDELRESGFKIIEKQIRADGIAKAILIPEELTRKETKAMEKIAKDYGFPGVAWTWIQKELKGGVAEQLEPIKTKLKKLGKGTLLILAGDWARVCEALGAMRLAAAEKLDLRKGLDVLWVTDFPLFKWSQEKQRLQSGHHPFTLPKPEKLSDLFENLSEQELLDIRSQAFDLVINGTEVGGGSMRITDKKLQERIFELLKIDRKTAKEKFGMLLKAFDYGVPPHGGIAFGFDRLLQVMLGKDSIRDVIAFPKNKVGRALMEDGPAKADQELLDELGIKTGD